MWSVASAKMTAGAAAAVMVVLAGAAPADTAVAQAVITYGYSPAQLQSAYGLQSASSGMRQTVAVVDPDDDPNAEADLGHYRDEFGLPPCTTANGCFTKVNQQGNAAPLPGANLNWALSISVSLDMISATCPNCRLLLVETTTPAITDIGAGVNTAVDLHASVITTGVTQPEAASDTTYDSEYFKHPGVAITAPAGDTGYGTVHYPAASPYVTAVGGTSLTPADSGTCPTAIAGIRGWCETAWADTSSGCSAYEPQPSWQAAAVADTGCGSRAVADTAADADPATGVAVYDTYETATAGWQPGPGNAGEGGTAVAAAIISGVYALAGTPAPATYPVSYLYQYPGTAAPAAAYPDGEGLNDVTTGSSGTCSPAPLCTAGTGYDAPTGMGSPAFTASFSGTGSQTGPVYSGVTGKCLDDYHSGTGNGNAIDIYACNGGAAQNWTLESDGTVKVFGDCLDVYHSGTANGTGIDLYACNGGGAQEWRPLADGSLVNPESGKCLADPSSSATNGTQLEIYTCNGIPGDQWILPDIVPSTTGPITSALSASTCVDDYHSGTANGTGIDIYACNGGNAQDWTIEPGGTLEVLGHCMATAADGITDGTAVQLYACSGDPDQQWISRPDGSLVNRRSGTCLDDPGASLTSGTALVISTCSQSAEQSWTLATPADSLVLTLQNVDVGEPLPITSPEGTQVTLTCDPAGGTDAAAQSACTDLSPVNGNISSLTVSGAADCGRPAFYVPVTATATGVWGGVPDSYSETFYNGECASNSTDGIF